MTIDTKSLTLIQCATEVLKAAASGNERLAEKLSVAVVANWAEFGIEALQYSLDKLTDNDEEQGWWPYLPIHKEGIKLIGCGGYKGKPTLTEPWK